MAWIKYFGLGVVAAVAAVACTVSSGDGTSDDDLNTGGDAGATSGGSGGASGGSGGASGGSTSGGSGGDTGGASNGGATNGGASNGGAGGAATCDPSTAEDACGACVQEKCCDYWLSCTDVECAGTETDAGEVQCVIDCMYSIEADAGSVSEEDLGACGIACAQGGDDVIAVTSDELISCMMEMPADGGGMRNCAEECFNLF